MTATMQLRRDRTAGAVAVLAVLATFGALLVALSAQSAEADSDDARTTLLDAAEHVDRLWIAAGLRAVALAATGFVCVRLLSAISALRPVDRRWPVLVVAGPSLLVVAVLLSQWSLTDVATDFRDGGVLTEARADDLLDDTTSQQVASILTLIAALACAVGVGWTALAAGQAGLTTAFLGYFGVGAAVAALVLPLAGQGLLASWLGSVGAVLLGMWRGGEGPAWEDHKP